ncbi:MAG: hypothetical protein IJQ85_03975 [Selenomonadaceae bacterium]|nr:hypothetical protein [Selenomonadaceae bacterium]
MNRFLPLIQAISLSACVVYWQIFFKWIEEADTRFVINLGKYILEHGFPHVDPFTVHENLQLVAQQWLSGVLFWEAYKNFGFDGLVAIDAVVGTAIVLIYWRLCLFVSDGNKVLSFVMSLIVGFLIAPAIVTRPHILSAMLFLIEVFCLEKFTRTENAKFLIPLPFLSIALVNFHAAVWLMSLVLCLPFLFVKNFRHIKFLLAALGGIFIGGLINPYGVEAMTYVFRSYGISMISENIPEMFTPSAHDFRGKFFYATEALLIISLARFKVPLRYIFLSGGLTFMAIMHGRNVILFYLLATIPIAYAWRELSVEKFKTMRMPMTILVFLLVAANTTVIISFIQSDFENVALLPKILFFATLLFIAYNLLIVKIEGRILYPTLLPRKVLSLLIGFVVVSVIFFTTLQGTQSKPLRTYTNAIEFLLRDERPENISLYVPQGIGGLAGSYGIKYYIDSRSEVFIPANNGTQKNILGEYLDFMNGKINYKDFFNRYDFTHIIVTSEKPYLFDELSSDKNFRVLYESEQAVGSEVIRCKIFKKVEHD